MGKVQGVFIPIFHGDKKVGEVHIRRRMWSLHVSLRVLPDYAMQGTIMDVKDEDAKRMVKYIRRMEALIKLEQKWKKQKELEGKTDYTGKVFREEYQAKPTYEPGFAVIKCACGYVTGVNIGEVIKCSMCGNTGLNDILLLSVRPDVDKSKKINVDNI